MVGRWLPKAPSGSTSKQTSRRGSIGSNAGDDHSATSTQPKPQPGGIGVNGIPDWENPTIAQSESPDFSHLLSSPRKRPPNPVLRANMNTTRSPSTATRPQEVSPVVHEEYNRSCPNFENMVIECDLSNNSIGEMTNDDSVVQDDDFRSQRNYQLPAASNPRSGKSHLQNYSRTPFLARSSSQGHHASTHVIPISPARSLEDEEMKQLELAMERSLQDSISHVGSTMSKSATSERSYMSYTSTGSNRGRLNSGMSLGHAGCHLSMAAGRTAPIRRSGAASSHQSRGPPGEAGPNFIWKREGKVWLKIPVNSDGLQAIEEENLQESFNRSSCLRLNLDGLSGEEKLEQMEQRMIEEAMQRSLANFDENVEIDQNAVAARLQELEKEKAMLELAMQRSMSCERSVYSDRMSMISRPSILPSVSSSQESSERRKSESRASSFRTNNSQELAGAGCHLAMMGRRRDERLDDSQESSRELHRSQSMSSRNSQGQNLVWKRGPNNVWGRFPEDDNDMMDPNLDEEALVAEALEALVATNVAG